MLSPDRPGRIRCEVIGCRRTAPVEKYPPGTRICCGKCWRTGPRFYRLLYSRCERRLKRTSDAAEIKRLEGTRSRSFWRIVEAAKAAKVGLR